MLFQGVLRGTAVGSLMEGKVNPASLRHALNPRLGIIRELRKPQVDPSTWHQSARRGTGIMRDVTQEEMLPIVTDSSYRHLDSGTLCTKPDTRGTAARRRERRVTCIPPISLADGLRPRSAFPRFGKHPVVTRVEETA